MSRKNTINVAYVRADVAISRHGRDSGAVGSLFKRHLDRLNAIQGVRLGWCHHDGGDLEPARIGFELSRRVSLRATNRFCLDLAKHLLTAMGGKAVDVARRWNGHGSSVCLLLEVKFGYNTKTTPKMVKAVVDVLVEDLARIGKD